MNIEYQYDGWGPKPREHQASQNEPLDLVTTTTTSITSTTSTSSTGLVLMIEARAMGQLFGRVDPQ